MGNLSNVRIAGRYTTARDGVLYLAGSAAYIEFKTKSSAVDVTFLSDGIPQEKELQAAGAVFIDGEEVPSLRFVLKRGQQTIRVYEAKVDAKKEVLIRIMKYSEQAFASFGIVDIKADEEIYPVTERKEKLIEFVGDSITCGYGIEGIVEKDIFRTTQENPWEAYACRTARLLDADFEMICWSGNGMISHYIPPEVDERRAEPSLIPEMYLYADRELQERMGCEELTVWTSEREPDLVVINIGTNDSSYTRNQADRNEFFAQTYHGFLELVRKTHPDAEILCVIGIMDQCVHEVIEQVVQDIRSNGDEKVHFLKAPLQLEEDGLGTDYHPTPITHKKASVLVADVIRKIWNS